LLPLPLHSNQGHNFKSNSMNMTETNIDELDKQSFGFRMRPVADHYYPRRHTDTKQSLEEERWKTEYSPYVEKLSGQVVPRKGEAWRFQRFDIHKAFKAVTMDVIQDYVSRFVSTDMIGLYPLALAAYGTLALETMCYLFYRFYAPFMKVKVDDDGNLVSYEIVSTHTKRFLLRCEAEEKVTRRISTLFNQTNDLASMERSESSREYPELNAELGGIYQNLEPRCNRVLLREFQRFVVKITEDFPLIKQVVLADLGSGMNLVPLFASAMFGWKGLGIEVVQNRVMLAAHAQRKLFEHEWFQKLKVAMYCGNLAVSEFNWAGILCFLCWDKVWQFIYGCYLSCVLRLLTPLCLCLSLGLYHYNLRCLSMKLSRRSLKTSRLP